MTGAPSVVSHQAEAYGLNTHQVIKFIAIIIMTIDHIGSYLYPDVVWLRAIGRVTFPVWFFLVGHALHYRIHRDVLLWAGVLIILNPLLGAPVFPLNALVTITCCQWLLGRVEAGQWLDKAPATMIMTGVLLLLPSYVIMEYGTLGFFYALLGYAVRSKQMSWRTGKMVAVVALGFFLAMTVAIFDFPLPHMVFVTVLTSLVTLYLAQFRHRPLYAFSNYPRCARVIHFLSRNSLQYYVVHRAVLQAAGVLAGIATVRFYWF